MLISPNRLFVSRRVVVGVNQSLSEEGLVGVRRIREIPVHSLMRSSVVRVEVSPIQDRRQLASKSPACGDVSGNELRIRQMFEELDNADKLTENWEEIVSSYVPRRIPLDTMEVPRAALPLVAVVAKTMHESWFGTRERLGWVHGPEFDAALKMHPDLVPFEELSEDAQERHEAAAAETIKLLVSAGYAINRTEEEKNRTQYTKVPDKLIRVLELIAYHLHEVWCKDKMTKGYKYGVMRSDKTKTHPAIVPYYLLEVGDRYFDQNSAEASILFILNSGCTISAAKKAGRSQSYEADYADSAYFNELQRQIRTIRVNLQNEVNLKQQWKMNPESHTKYTAEPLDLDAVRVPQELKHLVEICAESMHDSWMETNERQGWCYGEASDHTRKTHPAMIPYHDLPADLRESDRVSAEQTIRSILACGYTITNKSRSDPLSSPRLPLSDELAVREARVGVANNSYSDQRWATEKQPARQTNKSASLPDTEEPDSPFAGQTNARRITKNAKTASLPDTGMAAFLTGVATRKKINPTSPIKSRANLVKGVSRLTHTFKGRSTIPLELRELIEVIAYHLHETWSQDKMKQGWTHGEVRDNRVKKHPNLVPYYILTKSDRVYDLGSAEEAIMCVLKAGCKIAKPARILVGDLLSEDVKDKWAVSDKVMDAAIAADEELDSIMKLMDASEALHKHTATSPRKKQKGVTSPRSTLGPRTPRTAPVLKRVHRNSIVALQNAASMLEESVHDPSRTNSEVYGEMVGEGSQLDRSTREAVCRVATAVFRMMFDYRLSMNPEAYLVRAWGLFMTLATMYFILAVPVRLGFAEEPATWVVMCEIVLEMCFLYDLNVQMRLGFFNAAGELVMDVAIIRRNYIRRWLVLDLVASVPVQTLEMIAADSMGDLVFMKLLRLLKILRMFRLSKKRSSLVAQTPSFMRMVQLLLCFIGGLHYMSCIYWATAERIGFDDDPEHSWVPDTSYEDAPFSEKCEPHTTAFTSHCLHFTLPSLYCLHFTAFTSLIIPSLHTAFTSYCLHHG
jgi:ryanodine receptor 2